MATLYHCEATLQKVATPYSNYRDTVQYIGKLLYTVPYIYTTIIYIPYYRLHDSAHVLFFYDGCHVILYRLVSLYKVHGGYGPYKRRWYIYIDMATSWERECFNISEVTRTTKVRIRSGDRKEIYSFGLPDRTSPLQ